VCADELAAAFALVESLTDSAAPMSAPMLALHEQLKGIQGRLAAAVKRGASTEEIQADQGARARHAAARSARADATAVRRMRDAMMRVHDCRGAGRDRCGAAEARRRVRGRPGGGQGTGGPGRCVASRGAALLHRNPFLLFSCADAAALRAVLSELMHHCYRARPRRLRLTAAAWSANAMPAAMRTVWSSAGQVQGVLRRTEP
jgi:hypothetical protein